MIRRKDTKGRVWIHQYDSMWASGEHNYPVYKNDGSSWNIVIAEGRTIRHETNIKWG